MNEPLSSVGQMKATLVDLLVRFGPRLLAAILIIAIGLLVSGWVSRWATRILRGLDLEPPVEQLLTRVTRALVVLLFAILALQNLGVELLPLVAGLGVAGAGIALAMQGVLGNVAAGLSIIFTRPFRVGEYISIAGVEGRVRSITLFSTTLDHPDLSRIVIPNRKIVGEILHNYGNIRQLALVVGVAYDSDLRAVLAAVDVVLNDNPRVLKDPAPVVRAARLADSCIDIGIQPWVAVPDFVAASGELNRAIVESFRLKGIVIAYPQREVRLLAHGD